MPIFHSLQVGRAVTILFLLSSWYKVEIPLTVEVGWNGRPFAVSERRRGGKVRNCLGSNCHSSPSCLSLARTTCSARSKDPKDSAKCKRIIIQPIIEKVHVHIALLRDAVENLGTKVQRGTKRYVNLAKQDRCKARQSS